MGNTPIKRRPRLPSHLPAETVIHTTNFEKPVMDAAEELHQLRQQNAEMKAVIAQLRGDEDSKAEDQQEAALSQQAFAQLNEKALSIIVVGASGHLARTKTFPALYALYSQNYLPQHVSIVGFARSQLSDDEFHKQVLSKIKGDKAEDFFKHCSYFSGQYDSDESFAQLHETLNKIEAEKKGPASNRIFYFAIPPSVFGQAGAAIKKACSSNDGYTRIIVEKPFGKDYDTSEALAKELLASFNEDQLYRIDHYLGKEMVQNLMVLRFANLIFDASWNRHFISSVIITFKENVGVEGRGGYFDGYGIIRDVMQNHLTQILSLVAMEQPASMNAEDIRNEKVKVLRSVAPITIDDIVVGQYDKEPDGKNPAYTSEDTVPPDSVTPTFAQAVVYIRNPRWDGVPFILKCGKGLNERKAEVRIQYHKFPGSVFTVGDSNPAPVSDLPPNELVMRVQPDEAIYLKVMTKTPGLSEGLEQVELDLSYIQRFAINRLPDAYERLILDVVRGDHRLFVRNDELQQAWRIFTPVLHKLEGERIKPISYPFGSRGPQEATDQAESVGVKRSTGYVWKAPYQK